MAKSCNNKNTIHFRFVVIFHHYFNRSYSTYANKHWTPKHLDDYITDYGEFIVNRGLYCTFMAQYGASRFAKVHIHTHLYILRMIKKVKI